MNDWRWKIVLLFGQLMAACSPGYADRVYFAPEHDCTAVIVEHFDKAGKSIDYQLYNFTSPDVADALIRAHGRGVAVRILLDKRGQSTRYSQAPRCQAAGCQVRLDARHPIAHNKVRIVDGRVVLCGSFNDSRQANRNAENLVVEEDAPEVRAFRENFQKHWEHAEPL